MLAYLFWHRPRATDRPGDYESGLIEFHRVLQTAVIRSAVFRLQRLPFRDEPGYEDWYVVEDWAALGELNAAAVSGPRRSPHHTVATLVRDGWGGVYRLMRGSPEAPLGGRWASKPGHESYESFLGREAAETVWQRQLVLGPAPEFFMSAEASEERLRVWPPVGEAATR